MTIALKPNGDGSAEIQVNGTTQILISSAGVVTLPNTPNTQLGVDQTWQNVTSSRVVGVTYTNSTGKPIELSIVLFISGLNTSPNLIVSGVSVVSVGSMNTQYVTACYLSATVPNGATYSVAATAGVGISNWSELR